jgi:hypothetical protein
MNGSRIFNDTQADKTRSQTQNDSMRGIDNGMGGGDTNIDYKNCDKYKQSALRRRERIDNNNYIKNELLEKISVLKQSSFQPNSKPINTDLNKLQEEISVIESINHELSKAVTIRINQHKNCIQESKGGNRKSKYRKSKYRKSRRYTNKRNKHSKKTPRRW